MKQSISLKNTQIGIDKELIFHLYQIIKTMQ